MRHHSTVLLLSFAVLAASCGKNNYAQVEPDDLYFTHKDRKAALTEPSYNNSPLITAVEPLEEPAEYNQNDYANQHSPVLVSPGLGSPTIQQYAQKPYYDTSVNPDYLYEQEYTDSEGGSNDYYVEGYEYIAPPVESTPQIVNNYYGYPSSNSWNSNSLYSPYRPRTAYMIYVGGLYSGSYPSSLYWDNPYYYNSMSYNNWNSPYYSGYNYCNNGYSSYGNQYGGNYYFGNNNSQQLYNETTYYSDGTKVVNKPRQSRNSGANYVDKEAIAIKSRRENYQPESSEQGGRIASDVSPNSRTTVEAERVSYTRRGNSTTYTNNAGNNGRRASTVTVGKYQNRSQQGNRTVVVPTRTRTAVTRTSTASQVNTRRTTGNATRSTVGTRGNNGRSSAQGTKYTSPSKTRSNSSYGTRSSSGTRTSYGTRSNSSRSSGTRSSVNSSRSRSSSGSSYRAPSRSSGSSSRSYSPSRSSSTRSSGTTKSSGSTGRKKN